MMKRLIVCSTLAIATVLGACSGDDRPPGEAGGGGTSGAPPTTGTAGGGAGGDGGAPSGVPNPERLCEVLPQQGGEVPEGALWGDLPAPLGGTITPGTYVLAEMVEFKGSPPAIDGGEGPPEPPRSGRAGRGTLYVTSNTLRFLEARGMAAALPADATRGLSYTVGATTLQTLTQCPTQGTRGAIAYSAIGNTIAINVDATHRELYQRAP